MFGYRFPRAVTVVCGMVVGGSVAFWAIDHHVDTAAVPVLFGAYCALILGTVALLYHWFFEGMELGYLVGILVFALDRYILVGLYASRVWLYFGLCFVGLVLAYLFQPIVTIALAAILGSFFFLTAVDLWLDGSLSAILYGTLLHDGDSVLLQRLTCTMECWILLILTAVLTIVSFAVQVYFYRVEIAKKKPEKEMPLKTQPLVPHTPVPIKRSSSYELLKKGDDERSEYNNFHSSELLPLDRLDDAKEAAIPIYRSIRVMFEQLGHQFGFQKDNLANQLEHALMLISNRHSQLQSSYADMVNSKQSGESAFWFSRAKLHSNRGSDYVSFSSVDLDASNRPVVVSSSSQTSYQTNYTSIGDSPVDLWFVAVHSLHEKFYANYEDWCNHLGIASLNAKSMGSIVRSSADKAMKNGLSSTFKKMLIQEICLFLLIWGESANLRHIPECLCFLTHKLLEEIRIFSATRQNPPTRSPGGFLNCVVKPIFDVVAKTDIGGGMKRNYDDINEFFWSDQCLAFNYFNVSGQDNYILHHTISTTPTSHPEPETYSSTSRAEVMVGKCKMCQKSTCNCEEELASFQNNTKLVRMASAVPVTSGVVSIADALAASGKSFLENRNWLTIIRAFWRMYSFYLFTFSLMAVAAYLAEKNIFLNEKQDVWLHGMSSFVLILSVLEVAQELLEVFGSYDLIRPLKPSIHRSFHFELISLTVRLVIKIGFFVFLTLFYAWSWERQTAVDEPPYYLIYLFGSGIYLIPFAFITLAQIFPSLSILVRQIKIWPWQYIRKFWWPVARSFVGQNTLVTESFSWKYTLFWISILAFKFTISYITQVQPLIAPTEVLLSAKLNTNPLFPGFNYFLVFMLWVPFIFVFFIDLQIWYAVWSAIVGAFIGMSIRLGEVRDFASLSDKLIKAPVHFLNKLVNKGGSITDPPVRVAASEAKKLPLKGEFKSFQKSKKSPKSAIAPAKPLLKDYHQLSNVEDFQITQDFEMDEVTVETWSSTCTREDRIEAMHKMFHNHEWHAFALSWNKIVEEIRLEDLLSNAERDMMLFRFMDINKSPTRVLENSRQKSDTVPSYYLPLFLTAGAVDRLFQFFNQRAQIFRNLKDDSAAETLEMQKFEMFFLTNNTQTCLIREAINEFWDSTLWLISSLLGHKHDLEISAIISLLKSYASHGIALQKLTIENLSVVKSALSDLIRIMRLALAAHNKRQKAKKDEMGKNVQSSSETLSISKPGEKEKFSFSANVPKEHRALAPSPSTNTLALMEKISNKQVAVQSREEAVVAAKKAMPPSIQPSIKSRLLMPSASSPMLSKLLLAPPQSYYHAPTRGADEDRDINLIREQLRNFLQAIVKVMRDDQKIVANHCKVVLAQQNGFFWDSDYASSTLLNVLGNSNINIILESLLTLLSLSKFDAQPWSFDARRRLMFWMNSLFMDMPAAPMVRHMKSFSTLTPFYAEDVMYSNNDLLKQTPDGLSNLVYLQTIYPKDWQNLLERVGYVETSRSGILSSEKAQEARVWATNRGQTLYRTVSGMMLYQKALNLLAGLEEPTADKSWLEDVCRQKFTYVIACQVYGNQKKNDEKQASEIDHLLKHNLDLRVAYIDSARVAVVDESGNPTVQDEYYSVLVKAVKSSGPICEVYRVKLPGNPMIGEGKPENQNHAIIFTRGQLLQAIDMNQTAYFEEALKIKNLLQEFNSEKRPSIVGFREHIFTGSLSSIANYMALQEGTFVTLGQRVLTNPLCLRFHYGHPDLFDKTFFMSRGGVSKASKGINLSEDIFAGFNSVLRGSAHGSEMVEYAQVGKGRDVGLPQLYKFEAKLSQGAAEQALSRDVYRLSNSLDFFRLLTFYCAGLGFYISNCLTIWAIYLFLYSKMLLVLFRLTNEIALFSGTQTLSYWFGQIGFVLSLPVFCTVGVEQGFGNALVDLLILFLTGGPFYFTFMIGTKMFFFAQTILVGGAKYRPTGRGFVITHESFAETYRFYASSHFSNFFELFFGLLLYAVFSPSPSTYSAETWSLWLLAFAFGFSPFWFNPMGFEYDKIVADWRDWMQWMQRTEGFGGDPQKSWLAWWLDEYSFYLELSVSQRIILTILNLRFVLLGLGLIYQMRASGLELIVCISFLLGAVSLYMLSEAQIFEDSQFAQRSLQTAIFFIALIVPITLLCVFHVSFILFFENMQILLGFILIGCFVVNTLLVWGKRWQILIRLAKVYDQVLGFILLIPLFILSLLYVPSLIQTRLMFNNAFRRGVVVQDLLRGSSGAQSASSGNATVDLQKLVKEQGEIIQLHRDALNALDSRVLSNHVNHVDVPVIVNESENVVEKQYVRSVPQSAPNSLFFPSTSSTITKAFVQGAMGENAEKEKKEQIKLASEELFAKRTSMQSSRGVSVPFLSPIGSAQPSVVSSPTNAGISTPDNRPIPTTVSVNELVIKKK